MTGMVVEVDPRAETFVVSHDAIPGVMAGDDDAVRRCAIRDELAALTPGTTVTFTLVMGQRRRAYAERCARRAATRASSRIR